MLVFCRQHKTVLKRYYENITIYNAHTISIDFFLERSIEKCKPQPNELLPESTSTEFLFILHVVNSDIHMHLLQSICNKI